MLSIQYLRGLAALMVVVHHAVAQREAAGAGLAFLEGGVDIFFVISGVVMWMTTATGGVSPGLFVRKRLARITPLYWLLTTVVTTVALAAPRLLQSTRLDPAHVVASYLFVAWPNPTPGIGLRPLMIPGWTLNYEMVFYGLFTLALFAPRAARAAMVLGLLALLSAGSLLPGLSSWARFYLNPIVLEFAAGVAMAIVLQRWRPRLPLFPIVLIASGAALLVLGGLRWPGGENAARLVWLGLPAAAVVLGALALERTGWLPRSRLAKGLGDASYAIYLGHPIILSAFVQLWRRLPLAGAPTGLFVAAAVPVCLLGGLALHRLVERPATAWLQRRLHTGGARPVAPSLAEAPL